ncbi:hypothetical protein MMC24_006406 [Lignoscripta atroalba]|nr:hypothetical protein [Lignoscripta atroalba]
MRTLHRSNRFLIALFTLADTLLSGYASPLRTSHSGNIRKRVIEPICNSHYLPPLYGPLATEAYPAGIPNYAPGTSPQHFRQRGPNAPNGMTNYCVYFASCDCEGRNANEPLANCLFYDPRYAITRLCYEREICSCKDTSHSGSEDEAGNAVNEDIDVIWYHNGKPLSHGRPPGFNVS